MARLLRANGAKPDSIIAIMVERSPQMVLGILGILKAGAAYLPIDPEYPAERIAFILEDSQAEILLTGSWLQDRAPFTGKKFNLDTTWIYESEETNLKPLNRAHDLAYVIYTSGSTGAPKGVMMEHRGVVNMMESLFGASGKCPLLETDAYLLSTTYTFDVSTTELFGWFVGGGKLVILPEGAEKNPEAILKVISCYHITHINFVPAMLNVILDMMKMNEGTDLGKIKYLLVAGEPLGSNLVKKFFAVFKDTKLINAYGPSETTYTTLYQVNDHEGGSNIPIGKPLPNYQIYILNTDQQQVPLGVIGEICISGHGLARGYLNRPELTAAKFITNPFMPTKRLYRSGDLGRWLPDGNIQYLGRIDHQVKIRGFRVELGEIESRLLELAAINEAAVTVRVAQDGAKELCAYFVASAELPPSELRRLLAEKLPGYMIPSYFTYLKKLPLTANGKLDRRALPAPEGGTVTEYVTPKNKIEATLARIWSEVLNCDKVGVYDNFFDLGGHSLKAMVMIAKVHKELNVELPLPELFQTPTIAALSEYIKGASKSVYAAIEVAPIKEFYEASSAGKRLWLLQEFDPDSTAYNMSAVLIVAGQLSRKHLESVIFELIARHETLRTSFEKVGNQLVQRIAETVDFKIEYAESSEATIDDVIKTFIRPFALNKAPLLRVGLIKTAVNRYFLLFDMHHIISDGVSLAILTKEFIALYDGQTLAKQRLQYKDFSEWQNAYLRSEKVREQEKFWLQQLAPEIPTLDLPLDYPRPPIQSYAGGNVDFKLNRELTDQLNNLAKETETTLYMVLLAIVNILLFIYTEQEDIIVGTPIAGRPHADLEGIIGMFVNTLVMRNYPKSGKPFIEFLKEVKETALGAYANQDYQFESLVEKLNLERDPSRTPLFDVMFALQNMEVSQLELTGLRFTEYHTAQISTKFDLTFTATEAGGEIIFGIRYRTTLFKRETIAQMAAHLQELIQVIVADRTVEL